MSKSARQKETEQEWEQDEAGMTAAEIEARYPVPSGGQPVDRPPLQQGTGAALARLTEVFGTSTSTLESVGECLELADLDYESAVSEAGSYLDDWPLVNEVDLIGVAFIIVGVRLHDTDLNITGKYANIRCYYLGTGEKFSFNDSSSGVYAQLLRIASQMTEPRPIRVSGGLRVSTYHYSPTKGVTKEGTPNAATYYLTSSVSAKQAERSRTAIAALAKS